MAQYLTAQWDYTAEGNYELSFKEGDKIKLLEKHNDDWWEGELNDEIGFFPANRTVAVVEEIAKKISTSTSTPSSSSTSHHTTPNSTNRYTNSALEYNQIPPPEQQRPSAVVVPIGSNHISHNNPYLQQQSTTLAAATKREIASAPTLSDRAKADLLVDISTESSIQDDLPDGWCYSYDESGTIYFFNESTGESQWEKPTVTATARKNSKSSNDDKVNNEKDAIAELVYDIKKLNLDALHPNWIRIQSIIQMKIITDEGVEVPWKEYYAVLATRYLIIYKEGLNKTSRRPSSIKPVAAYGTIDIQSSEIGPVNKNDTRKKNSFIITNKDMKILVSVANETLYSEWLDAIMRELISRKENLENQDVDLQQLLASIPLKEKIVKSVGKTAAEIVEGNNPKNNDSNKSASSLTRWLSRSSRNSMSHKHNVSTESPPPSKEVFGGYLKLEEDGSIPLVVRLCIEQVDKRGLDVVGIYRLSGQSTSIQKYKNQFNTNPQDVNLDEENDINVITGLLKLYFRELKNPLLTYEYYDRFIEASRLQDYDEHMFRLKSIIQVLPVANYKVFQYLVRHLERVKNQSDVNKMEASNLALIFSIGLLRSKQDDLSSSIIHSDLLSKMMEIIIQHVDWFFDTDTDDELLIEDNNSSINNNSSIVL